VTFSNQKRENGFTLLEVLVAMAILATAMVVLLESHASSIRISDTSRRLTVGSALARDLMTEIELQGFPSPGSETGDFEQWYPDMYPDYRWEMEIQESMIWQNVREVYVKVLWTETGGERHIELANFAGAMDLEEQDQAASESGGVSSGAAGYLNAYQNAASGTKGAGQLGGGF
jgi:general secretion pathway protein I